MLYLSVCPCICPCVGLSSALWKNGGLDPDAVWHHRSDGSRDEADSGVWGSVHGKGYFWGEFGARHCNQWRLYGVRVRQRHDAALFPNYFGQTCLNSTDCQSINRFISDRKPTNQYKKLWYRRDSMRCVKRPLNVTQGRPLLCQSTRHMISY